MRKYFSENYVIPSPKLNEDQKKVFAENWRIRWRPKKKGLYRNMGLYLAGIFRIYSCWLALFRLIIQRSNLDRGTHFPASPLQFKYENRHRAAIKYTTSKTIPRTPTTCGGLWWYYPTPSEGWGRWGTPWRPNSWATPQGLDHRSWIEREEPKIDLRRGSEAGQSRKKWLRSCRGCPQALQAEFSFLLIPWRYENKSRLWPWQRRRESSQRIRRSSSEETSGTW